MNVPEYTDQNIASQRDPNPNKDILVILEKKKKKIS